MGAPPERISGSGGRESCHHAFRDNGTNAHKDAEEVMITRVAATAALVAAIVVVVLVVLGGSSTYTLHADFTDAGGRLHAGSPAGDR